jgi:hypothetical protein
MSASPQLDDDMVNKLATMLRMIAERALEADGALMGLKRVLQKGGKDLADAIVQRLEQMSEADYQAILDEGIRIGRQEAQTAQAGHGSNGHGAPLPSPHDMAAYCYEHIDDLGEREREFIADMMSWTRRRQLSPKQQNWLEKLYFRLGGRV